MAFLELPQNSRLGWVRRGLASGGTKWSGANAGLKLLSVPVTEPQQDVSKIKKRSAGSFPAGEREPGERSTLRLRASCPSHMTEMLHRAALKNEAGGLWSKNRDAYAAAFGFKTKPRAAAGGRPGRVRHQSTRKRRARATAICLARLPLALRSFSRAQMTPRYSGWNVNRRHAASWHQKRSRALPCLSMAPRRRRCPEESSLGQRPAKLA